MNARFRVFYNKIMKDMVIKFEGNIHLKKCNTLRPKLIPFPPFLVQHMCNHHPPLSTGLGLGLFVATSNYVYDVAVPYMYHIHLATVAELGMGSTKITYVEFKLKLARQKCVVLWCNG